MNLYCFEFMRLIFSLCVLVEYAVEGTRLFLYNSERRMAMIMLLKIKADMYFILQSYFIAHE